MLCNRIGLFSIFKYSIALLHRKFIFFFKNEIENFKLLKNLEITLSFIKSSFVEIFLNSVIIKFELSF